jgi:hypothetical protein
MTGNYNLLMEVRHLFARQTAMEAVLIHAIVPLLVAFDPKLARELTDNIRNEVQVRVPNNDEELRLMFDEYLQQLVDKIDGRVRSNLPSRR